MTGIHESVGGYAVDALDPAELTEFETHLATCPTCRDEAAALTQTAAQLTLLTQAAPPPTLRANVLTAIRTTPQLSGLNGAAKSTPALALNGSRPVEESRRPDQPVRPRRAAPEPAPPQVEEEPETPVDELALRRQRHRTRLLTGLLAAMLALAVGLGGVVYTLLQQRQAQAAQTTLEQQLYAAPDTITTTSTLPDGGQATFIASRQLNRALFLGTDLPDPGPNRYQLWTATGTDPDNLTGVTRDLQVTTTDTGIKAFFTGNITTADYLAVNLEPAGSTPPTPTNTVLAAGPTTV